MNPYVIYGAGAVGSVLAAYLSRAGHRVLVVGRRAHVEAIRHQNGIRTRARSEEFLAEVEPHTVLPVPIPHDARVFFTVQSSDLVAAVSEIGSVVSRGPVVTWQNGIQAETAAAPVLPLLYGGVVRFTATLLEPGEVRLRSPGKLILGRHPEGSDEVAASMAEDLNRAGFEAAVSPRIHADKALKLLVNLVSGPPVLLKRTGKDAALAAVQVALLEEARTVFDRAGIEAYPASGLGPTVDELIAHFRAGGSAPDTSGGIYNSTWQNLHHRRSRLENRFYHGEVIRLGKATGIPTPVNERALDVLESVRRRGLGPEPFDAQTFRATFADVVTFMEPDPNAAPDPDSSSSLEI